MRFDPDRMAFGRHETFAVRYGWLPKGFQAVTARGGKKAFESDDATVRLGVGKNMVTAIRYWLRACRMIEPDGNVPTEIGKRLLSKKDGYDPYLEDDATIWLLHWLLATNAGLATSWYWFFNRYHKPDFTGRELAVALSDFVNDQATAKRKPAAGTLRNDSALLPKMYTQSGGSPRIPLEESLDSPFASLGLVTQASNRRSYQSRSAPRPGLPLGIFGFAVAEMFEARDASVIPVEELAYGADGYPAAGSVFRLTESAFVEKLERLTDFIPGVFSLRDQGGLHQVYRSKKISPMRYIDKHYRGARGGYLQ